MTRKNLGIMLFVLFIADAFVIGGIVAATHSPQLGITIGVLALAFPFVLLMGIMPLFTALTGWDKVCRRYPGVPDAFAGKDAKLQSMALHYSGFNFNNCVEIRSDDHHLHLRIVALIGKWNKPASIPWEAVTSIQPASFGRVKLTIHESPPIWITRANVDRELQVRSMPVNDDPDQPVDDALVPTSGDRP